MHAYAENRANYPTAVQELDDSDPPNALTFNTGPEAQNDRLANLNWRLLSVVGQFRLGLQVWSFTLATSTSLVAWDGCKARWMTGRNGSGTVMASIDDGLTWDQIGGTLPHDVNALIIRPSDGVATALMSAGGVSTNLAVLNPVTDTWSTTTGPNLDTAGNPGGIWFAGGGGVFVFWETRPTNPMRVHWATNGLAYSADVAGGFPANFGTGSPTLPTIFPAASSSLLVLFSTSTAGHTQYVASVDGNTWTTETLPTLSTNEVIIGACYDAQRAQFLLQVQDFLTGASRLFKSSSGLTASWSVITPTAPATRAYALDDLVAINVTRGVYAGATVLAQIASPWALGVIPWRVLLSADGGATWQLTNLKANAGRLTAGDSKLMYFDHTNFAVSEACGPLPDVIL